MTHAEALAHDRHAFPGRSCPGALVETGRHTDDRLDPAGHLEPIAVVTYRCAECGRCLAIEGDGMVRNMYQVYVATLAGLLDAKPRLARAEDL